MSKIIGILGVVCVILILVLSYTTKRIDALKGEKNDLKNEICNLETEIQKRDMTIKEMEKINELYQEVAKENEKFKEELNNDMSDNLDVVPADYILNRLHKD